MDVRVSVCALVHAPLPELLDFHEHEFVVPGDEIHVNADAGFLKCVPEQWAERKQREGVPAVSSHDSDRGHGTQLVDGRLLATTCGTVMRVNKLVSVKPLKSRRVELLYAPRPAATSPPATRSDTRLRRATWLLAA